jgi:methyltransferase (TIGR00027 family)
MSNSIFRKDGTAQGVSKQRLIESLAKPENRVIYDPYADNFVLGSRIIKIMGNKLSVWLTKKFVPGFHEHLISRTRFIDDLIEKYAAKKFEQYVILGAGYDSRAHRLNLPSGLKIFEVDQVQVQERKLSKLSDDISNSKNITYVNIDFNIQSLKEQLLNAGFDKSKSTIFTLEGVSQYITKEAINSTLNELAILTKNSNSILFISYVNRLLRKNPKACFGKGYVKCERKAEIIQNLAAQSGEPWISLYSKEEIEDLLSQNGYLLKEDKTLADLNCKYFTPIKRTIPESQIFKLEHFVVAARRV